MSEVAKAIVSVMEKIGAIKKGKTNEKQGYRFRGIDDVLNHLQPALVEAGLMILPSVVSKEVTERETKSGGSQIHIICEVSYKMVAKDGSSLDVGPFLGEAMDVGDKACNKAMATAYKYMAFQTFCIPVEELKDSDSDSPEAGKPSNELSRLRAAYASLVRDAQSLGLSPSIPGNGWTVEEFRSAGYDLKKQINEVKAQR